jgi:hypothetical protein
LKKLSEQNRRHLARKSQGGCRLASRRRVRHQRDLRARDAFFVWRDGLPPPSVSRAEIPGHIAINPPARFDIYENYEETLGFLLDFRSAFALQARMSTRGSSFYANFAAIEELDPASGLLIAAEVDRFSRSVGRRPRSFDNLWHENIRDFFHDAGLFELLGIDPISTRSTSAKGSTHKTLRYQSGTHHEGLTADQFRLALEELIGQSIGPKQRVYDALSEAMTNVGHHAYPAEESIWPRPAKGRWWLGGSWEPSSRVATVQMYDQGVGIPRTLPRSKHWSEVLPIFGRIDRERTDAGMIEAAMDYGRTSTGEVGRGKGLAQMAEWITEAGNGSLRILSGKGALTYLPGERPIRRNLPVEFRGTLIEWIVHL